MAPFLFRCLPVACMLWIALGATARAVDVSPMTLDACAKPGERVVVEPLLPLAIRRLGARPVPAHASASPGGSFAFEVEDLWPHPRLLVWRGAHQSSLRLTAKPVPGGRPVEGRWLSPDVLCVQASFNPAAWATWLVDVRSERVLAAGSLQSAR